MRACPHCTGENEDEALLCKFCKTELKNPLIVNEEEKKNNAIKHKFLKNFLPPYIIGIVFLLVYFSFNFWYVWNTVLGFFSPGSNVLYIVPALVIVGFNLFLFVVFKCIRPKTNKIEAVLFFLLTSVLLVPISEKTGASNYIRARWMYHVTYHGKVADNFGLFWKYTQCVNNASNNPMKKDKAYYHKNLDECEMYLVHQ